MVIIVWFYKKKKKMAMSHLEPKELTLIGELNQINWLNEKADFSSLLGTLRDKGNTLL